MSGRSRLGLLRDASRLVTGSAQGIGQATAVRLAEDGADVVGVDVSAQDETGAAGCRRRRQLVSAHGRCRGRRPDRSTRCCSRQPSSGAWTSSSTTLRSTTQWASTSCRRTVWDRITEGQPRGAVPPRQGVRALDEREPVRPHHQHRVRFRRQPDDRVRCLPDFQNGHHRPDSRVVDRARARRRHRQRREPRGDRDRHGARRA